MIRVPAVPSRITKTKLSLFIFAALAIAGLQQSVFAGGQAAQKISYDSVPTTQLCVALTFSDGPSQMLTPQVLRILAERHVKATFFPVGEGVQSYPAIVRQEVAEGHEVGSRAWSRPMMANLTDEQWRADLARADHALKAVTGKSPKLFSPFSTDFTAAQCEWVNREFGYQVILWNVDAVSMKEQGAAAIASSIVAQVKPGSIIQMTDAHSVPVEALPLVIDALAARGCKFVTVPELIAAGNADMAAQHRQIAQSKSMAANRAARSSAPAQDDSHPFGTMEPPAMSVVQDYGTGN